MAYPTPAVTTTTAATFIPEIWSDEIVAAYKKNLVLANIVMKMNFKGKKGDTVHIPAPTRGSASAKAASTAVTLIADTETEVLVSINQHFEYSRFIEDIVEAQALNSLRQFYTADAGYALAKQVDTSLIQLGRAFNGATVGTNDYLKFDGSYIVMEEGDQFRLTTEAGSTFTVIATFEVQGAQRT